MVKCEKCDKVNLEDAKFCNGCGNKLIHPHKESTEKEKPISKKHEDVSDDEKKWVYVVISVLCVVLALAWINNYCNQIVPKQVEESYTAQEPYQVMEMRTRTQYIEEDHCNQDAGCSCVERYLGIFKSGCKACNCQITEQIPVTKYNAVQKTRIVTKDVKRCTFLG